MKKSLVALAVSTAAFAMTSAHAADFDISGNLQYAYKIADSDTTDDASALEDNGSAISLSGTQELKGGLTGFFKTKWKAASDEKASESITLDEAYAGVKGSFGKVQVGTFDSIYNNAIQDPIDQFQYIGFTDASTTEEGDTLAYFSPSFGGLEIQASAQTKGSDDVSSDGKSDTAVTSVIKYTAGDFGLAVGYDSMANSSDPETYGLAASYAMGSVSATLKYETNDDDTALGLGVYAPYTAGSIYASFQTVDLDDESADDYDEYGAGITYNLDTEGNFYVYAEAGQTGSDETSYTVLGTYYGF